MHRTTIGMCGLACLAFLGQSIPVGGQTMPPKTLTNSQGMSFASIAPGQFQMGSPASEIDRFNDETQHEVTLTKGFLLGVREVTQNQYEAVMGKNPSFFKGATLPVETVSYLEAVSFCQRLSDLPVEKAAGRKYRLPTEAEWEYACRAGTNTPFPFGNELNGAQANCNGGYPFGTTRKGPFLEKPSPTGSYQTNAWGLYDMQGNVWEWCSDWYGAFPEAAAKDPQGSPAGPGRVMRGGSWINWARNCRTSIRGWDGPDRRCNDVGFRVVLQTGP